jgi:prolyl-tRNA editing enzyme YbaK/EbsC (Cys-tRNA(Pro) deacylase)
MLDRVVRYLREHGTPFRLTSQPSPEPLPAVAHSVPPGGLMVETQVLLVGGQPAIACSPRGVKLELPALVHELRLDVVEATPADLPPPFTGAAGPIPPLGGLMGLLTIVDARVATAAAITFAAFSPSDYLDIPYDDLARLERPRVASFAIGGELPEPARKIA